MRFTFRCQAIKHVTGRVTVVPLDYPELAVHAADVARAVEELTLALDDRISRAHPRRAATFGRPAAGEAITLRVPVLRVRGAEKDEVRELRVSAVVAPAHRPYTEVRVPRLGTRFWLQGKAVADEARELLTAQLDDEDDDDLLDLTPEGPEQLMDVEVEVTPLRLSDLKRSELALDERPPPRPKDEEAAEEDDEDGVASADADWDEGKKKKPKAAPAPKKPRRAPTPTLKKIGTPWHTLAREDALDRAWERDELVTALLARLGAKDPEPIVLVGPAGGGKTAILHELARRMTASAADADDPTPIWYVDGSRLIAGEGFFGDWQRQVLDVLAETRKAEGVLCLGHVGDLLDAGKSAHSQQNVAQLLAPALAAREVRVVAEATTEEWARLERRNAAFARVFAVVRIDEPDAAATRRIVGRVAADAADGGPAVHEDAVDEVLSLCGRFMPYGALVGNAVAFLRRLVAARAQAMATRVGALDATALMSSESGIPLGLLRDDEALHEADVRAFLAARVKGQEAAVARVAQVISVIKANLADRRRPTGVLFFAGPTGVGKTELAKALAEFVFGARERLVRLDMGEYAGPDALARLVGDGGGAGHLTAAVRRQPFSVVLLDEIEKAHPAVFDALLGVLGEGRLSDAAGKLTDFRSTIIVMTSNLGAESWRGRTGFGGAAAGEAGRAALEAHYRAEAQRFFRPELFNRLDDIVVFSPLGAAEIRAIVGRELERVTRREGLRRRDADLVVPDAARDWLATRGLDPRYGARPLKRAIERELVAPVAAYLAAHPQPGALRLEAGPDAAGAALAVAAESLGGAAEGVSRALIEKVLERAAALRAEVRRWARSRPMVRLRQELAFFERLSRHPSFWADRALADERARAAAEGRELAQAYAAAEKQAEAAEDLAYEAYYARQVAAAESLGGELDEVERQLRPLGERLYATLFPPVGTVALTIMAGRGLWDRMLWLIDGYERWVEARGGRCAFQIAVEHEQKPAKEPKGDRPKKTREKKAEPSWRWHARRPHGEDKPPAAVIMTVRDVPAPLLLAAEHGVHRFTTGGHTQVAKVRFDPRFSASALLEPPELEKRMPSEEIRRIWPDRKLVHDVRLQKNVQLAGDRFELGPLLDAWMSFRIFSKDEVDAP
jgi:ATP-dependent Clp protease ATP-binding subunit ClpA